VLLGLAPDGVCPDAPRHRDTGALLPHHFTFACARLTCGRAIGRVVSAALSRGFPRVGITDRPCPLVSGLSSRDHLPRNCMAYASSVGAATPAVALFGRYRTPKAPLSLAPGLPPLGGGRRIAVPRNRGLGLGELRAAGIAA